jgi:Ca2+-binding EF-hand superfamily protein
MKRCEQLLFFAEHGDLKGLATLHQLGFSLDYTDYDYRSAAHLAASTNQIKVLKYLHKKGVYLHSKDRWKITPYDEAKLSGYREAQRLLKELVGCDFSICEPHATLPCSSMGENHGIAKNSFPTLVDNALIKSQRRSSKNAIQCSSTAKPRSDSVEDNENKGEQNQSSGTSNEARLVRTYESSRLADKFQLNPSQVDEAQCVFDACDADNCGTLSKANLRHLLQALIQERFPQERDALKTHFPKYDMVRDDRLTFEEFLELTTPQLFDEGFLNHLTNDRIQKHAETWHVAPEDIRRLKEQFDEYDLDCSGWVDFKEFQMMVKDFLGLAPNFKVPRDSMLELWREADIDGSGQLDFNEFVIFYYKYLSEKSSELKDLLLDNQ